MVDYSIDQGLNYFLIDHTFVIMKFENVYSVLPKVCT